MHTNAEHRAYVVIGAALRGEDILPREEALSLARELMEWASEEVDDGRYAILKELATLVACSAYENGASEERVAEALGCRPRFVGRRVERYRQLKEA